MQHRYSEETELDPHGIIHCPMLRLKAFLEIATNIYICSRKKENFSPAEELTSFWLFSVTFTPSLITPLFRMGSAFCFCSR
ncbi:hypothetical protein VNO80_24051 [Phaseolus coccineus]|uniref:Uncharacterized protein n=1 Tax=Phaseolus coccineus TaxID=3886 RepID=A0AAN9LSU4_PHACN